MRRVRNERDDERKRREQHRAPMMICPRHAIYGPLAFHPTVNAIPDAIVAAVAKCAGGAPGGTLSIALRYVLYDLTRRGLPVKIEARSCRAMDDLPSRPELLQQMSECPETRNAAICGLFLTACAIFSICSNTPDLQTIVLVNIHLSKTRKI